ncbi:GNAT family N-acetyltransferase [Nonomuraea sp. NPDC052129]|uniref:GNAT family N-acetyltransferase n=1 Tax=Nonomuraea sp. NPDC052129 TaxID=3154651 RepID=UPI00341AE1A8
MIAVRELHEIAEFEELFALFDGIWRFDQGGQPITVELMRALSHAGGYVAGAFDGDRMAGGSVGFLAAGNALHSHITGASAGRGIGFELKLHQRRWALERELGRVTWTYDPLVRRNAHFNLAKLGARPREYLPGFYGIMDDEINQGDESDRMLAVWELSAPHVEALARREPWPVHVPGDAVVGLADDGGRPVPGRMDAAVVLVAAPPDIEGLRRADPGTAKAWRHAMRDVLGGLIAEGRVVTGFHQKSFYVVEKA